MRWFRPKCPVPPREQAWIDDSMRWFVAQFGPVPQIVLPSSFSGGADIKAVFTTVAKSMHIDPGRVDLELYSKRAYNHDGAIAQGAAGHYQTRNGRPIIAVETGQAITSLVSTLAHELGHVLLLGGGRITTSRRDHEPLTDLLTVYFGLGIFSANAAFEFSSHQRGWGWERLGYLTEPMYGYALARYTLMREEPKPTWAEHIDLNPRSCMRQALRFLAAQE